MSYVKTKAKWIKRLINSLNFWRPLALSGLGGLLLMAFPVSPAGAAPVATESELQAAVDAANDGDQITLSPGLTINSDGTIRLPNKNLVINGQGGAIVGVGAPPHILLDVTDPLNVTYYHLGGLKNITFENGYSAQWGGGAVRVGGDLSGGLEKVSFVGNSAEIASNNSGGGAVRIGAVLSGGISDSVFKDNTLTQVGAGLNNTGGGALYVHNKFTGGLSRSSFEGNQANGVNIGGGAILLMDDFEGSIADSIFKDNRTTAFGGALAMNGDFKGDVIRSTFEGNRAVAAGALWINGHFNGDIRNSTFTGNVASTSMAGAVKIYYDLTGNIVDSNFTGNLADADGGAVNIGGQAGYGSLKGGIYNSTFSGNITTLRYDWSGSGGAVYVDVDLESGIRNSVFTANLSGLSGGAVYVRRDLQGGIAGSSFTDNSGSAEQTGSGGFGGAVSVGRDLSGGVSGTVFSNNSVRRSGGALYVSGSLTGGLKGSVFQGNYTTREFDHADDGNGGAVSVTNLYGGIVDSSFTGNKTVRRGGAVYVAGAFTGGISGSVFEGNVADGNLNQSGRVARGNGGALYVGAFEGLIENSSFRDNRAVQYGGAVFFDTSSAGDNRVELSAGAGRSTVFSGNTDSSGANSLHFGRYIVSSFATAQDAPNDSISDAYLTVSGEGLVALYDPLAVNMNNGRSFQLTRSGGLDSGGHFIWGGLNSIKTGGSGSSSAIDLSSGLTTLTSDFSLVNASDQYSLTLGAAHRLALSGEGRPENLAAFDLGSTGRLTVENGSVITAPHTLRAFSGRYLLVDNDSDYLSNINEFSLNNTHQFRAGLDAGQPGQININIDYDPFRTPAGGLVNPNVAAAKNALVQLFDQSPNLAGLSDRQFQAVLDNLPALTPEAAVSAGLSGLFANGRVMDSAQARILAARPVRSGTAGDDSSRSRNFWVGYQKYWLDIDSQDAYSGLKAKADLFLSGVGFDLNDHWEFGGWIGFSKSEADYDLLAAKSDLDGRHFGLYSRFAAGSGFSATLSASRSAIKADLSRMPAGLVTRADIDQKFHNVGLLLEHEFIFREQGRLTPFIDGRFTRMKQDALTETGPLAAYVDEISADYFSTTVGVNLSYDFDVSDSLSLRPRLSLGWAHDYSDRHLSAGAYYSGLADPIHFTVSSPENDQDALKIGLGLEAQVQAGTGKELNFIADYVLEASANQRGHSFFTGLEYKF